MKPVPVTLFSSNSSSGSMSRWCPTPEQLMLLEEMYRGGLKTPTTTQIQQITARLSLYGRIQGKNGGANVAEDKSSCRNMVNEGNVDQMACKKATCDCSLKTVMMESTSSYCIRVPPETLQLFPITPSSPLNPSQPK
ncbi:hypothetical protein E3N88_18553 [Mikania micrantha]|uniref:Homeobox domain-containing protein n=1 Tax=Mikania micrantha TaxID=192012 RepID=A0A5N6NNP0_9ASTR|nr:hypothetical protein E3N88_18553 [Mikania micrantha]